METPIIPQLIAELEKLPPQAQRQVLAFTRSLSGAGPQGISGRELLKYAGTIPPDDLRLMQEAIDEGCGQAPP